MAKILINVPDEMLKQVDKKAKKNHLTRSEATREAFRRWLADADYLAPANRAGFGGILERMMRASKANKGEGTAEKWIREDRETR